LSRFGYRLTDGQIDSMLKVDENSVSAGAARFTRDYNKEREPEAPE
jgi:hypothetical protein